MDFLLVLLMHFPLVLPRAKRQYFTSSKMHYDFYFLKMHYGKCTGMDGAMDGSGACRANLLHPRS